MSPRRPVVLSIAGSDPSGGAGVQADLKTMTALGAYGAAVLTSLTAQNTHGVRGVHPVPARFVAEQYAAVLDDVAVDAVKIGMLGSAEVATAVADALTARPVPVVVLDPVMVASSGDRLLDEDAVAVLRERLLPLADLVTPNLPEAGALLGRPAPTDLAGMRAAALGLRERGAVAALVKGGHLVGADAGPGTDVLAAPDGTTVFASPPVSTRHTHGTGCTLSTAIACGLAAGQELRSAVEAAKAYLDGALRAGAHGLVGSGRGPVDHLWAWAAR